MITTAVLALGMVSSSLTISPIGLSVHGYDVSGLKKSAPRKLDRNAQVTWHPEFMLTYKTEHMQYSAFYFKDTINRPAGGAFLGPKLHFLRVFDIGGIVGLFCRDPKQMNFAFGIKVAKDMQIIPLAGATLSVEIPITKHLAFEANAFSNYLLTHATGGIKFSW